MKKLARCILLSTGLILLATRALVALQNGPGHEERIRQLLDALDGEQAHRRRWAVSQLGRMGPDAVPAIPVLLDKLDDNDAEFRRAVVGALSQIDVAREDVVLALISALDDQDGAVSRAAVNGLSMAENVPPRAISLAGERLQREGSSQRSALLILLAKAGPDAKRTTASVAEVIKDENAQDHVRALAVETLPRINDDHVQNCQFLRYALEHGTPSMRASAVKALWLIPPDTAGLVPTLIVGLDDRAVALGVSRLLGRIGPSAHAAIPALRKNLRGDQWASISALHALVSIGPAAIPVFIDALKDEDQQIQYMGHKGLQAIGVAAVPALMEALRDHRAVVRSLAARTLKELRAEAKDAVPDLIRTLRDENADVRANAARALGMIGPEAKGAVPALVPLLKDPAPEVRRCTATAFRWIRSEAAIAVPALIESLHDEHQWVRSDVVEALEAYGPQAQPAIPILIEVLKSGKDDWIRRERACRALGAMGVSALPQLLNLLQSDDPATRGLAARTIGLMGPVAEEAVPALIDTLHDEHRSARSGATRALGRIGPRASTAIEALAERQDDDDPLVRQFAAEALGAINPDTPSSRAALVRALKDEIGNVRFEALNALGKAKNIDPELVTVVITALDDRDSSVRSLAIALLRNMGAKARSAIPALQALTSDEHLGRSANEALKKIQAGDNE